MAPRQQRDRRRPHRRRAAFAAVPSALRARSRVHATVRRGSGHRATPARIRRAARAGSRSPRRRPAPRSLRADRRRHRARRALPSARRPRPAASQQEAQEVARRDRLDLGAQPLDRVMVDPREQPALAPFLRRPLPGVKRPRKREAFGLERRQRSRDLVRRKSQRCRKRISRDRPMPLQPAAQDLDQRVIVGPLRAAWAAAPRSPGRACAPARAPGTAASARRRSTGCACGACSSATRLCRASSANQPPQPGFACASSAVRKPSHTRASCNSSALAASGQASACTRAIASGSRRPISAAASGASQRRAITAWVRRSSSGASSR